MKSVLTKIGITTGVLGAIALGATSASFAKSRHAASSAEKIPYNYTCQRSWFYPGYYCYEPDPYDWRSSNWNPAYYAYDSYSCTAAVWDGWRWVRRQVC